MGFDNTNSWLAPTYKKAEPVSDSKFFIIWNPSSSQPSTRQFTSSAQARVVAERMAKSNPGEKFYVLEASEYYEVQAVVRKTLR